MPNTIHCPSCNRELRVPDDLLGKKVKCPACSTTFTASVAGPEAAPQAAPAPPVLQESGAEPAPVPQRRPTPDEVEGAYDQDFEPSARPSTSRRSRGLAVLRAPAICLLVSSVVGVLGAGLIFLNAAFVPKAEAEAQMQVKQPPRSDQERQFQSFFLGFFYGPGAAVLHLVFIGVNLLIILSSVMMLIGKLRWLAYIGCVLAILNLDCGCCLLGIPFGIWSLIALNNADAKAAFE
jgi:predicted Zn finger-like uncharacterized protein